ncbi:uncharacterized protein BDZ99DRAFT_527427 [Mytilinidion resinicola]|uniref:DNA-binding protein RAP1 n=1 Tax=Mytilinidion resinicola TaxID=574789 RepID=A0A6A6Y1K4_9PEZI|nr:uncharacterized protein BDZ99DRAFT_527427 [Mytilinidion resinicola]KAF2802393.1 hypothetical protein BDZ99DRAFT_527427 [Mytilinidion resinicola]
MAEVRPQVVYSDVAEGADLQGQLFAGKKFFIAQRCPMRSSFVEQVKSNGGKVVPLEKLADYIIVDHMRKDIPAGSISYTFIEQSIRKGELQDPDDHVAGEPAGTVREIGSFRPTKSGRIPFTAEDDRQLYNWIKSYERDGSAIMGNVIYKQLEEKNPRHPWQSWRDRYVKHLQYKPPPGCAPTNGPLSPPSDVPPSDVDSAARQPVSERRKDSTVSRNADRIKQVRSEVEEPEEAEQPREAGSPVWNSEDWDELYNNVPIIQNAPARDYIAGWEPWAQGTDHTAQQWRDFYEKTVLPRWEKDQDVKDTIEVKPAKEQRQRPPSPSVIIYTPKKNTKNRNSSSAQKPRKSPVQASTATMQSLAVGDSVKSRDDLIYELMGHRKGRQQMVAYRFYFEAHRHELEDCDPTDYSAPHRKLNPRWKALSGKEQAPYYQLEAADRERHRLESNPTEYREWRLQYINSSKGNSSKRGREEDDESEETQKEFSDSRRSKKQRQQESVANQGDVQNEMEGQDQDVVDQSQDAMEDDQAAESSHEDPSMEQNAQRIYVDVSDDSEPEEEDEAPEEAQEARTPKHRVIDLSDDEDESEEEQEDEGQDEVEEVDHKEQTVFDDASASPSPHQSRYKPPTALDTQAILADPTQVLDVGLADLPNSQEHIPNVDVPDLSYTQGENPDTGPVELPDTHLDHSSDRSSSPLPDHAASDGTSHSIQEFRSLEHLERQRQSTPPLDLNMPEPDMDSDVEWDSQEDPDPPLDGEATMEFYHEMLDRGYDDELIRDVMRACMTRAKLSEEVLAKVAHGEPWPERRGVWTAEDDEDLESTDARRVRRVIKKHTDDEWGGCMERRTVLEYIRQVSEQRQG